MWSAVWIISALVASCHAQVIVCSSHISTLTFTEYSTVYATLNTTVQETVTASSSERSTDDGIVTRRSTTTSTISLTLNTPPLSSSTISSSTSSTPAPSPSRGFGFENVPNSELYPTENAVSPDGWELGSGVFFYDNSNEEGYTTPYGDRFVVAIAGPGHAVSFQRRFRDLRRDVNNNQNEFSFAYKILTNETLPSKCIIYSGHDGDEIDYLPLEEQDLGYEWTIESKSYTRSSANGMLQIALDCTDVPDDDLDIGYMRVAFDEIILPALDVSVSTSTSSTVSIPSSTTMSSSLTNDLPPLSMTTTTELSTSSFESNETTPITSSDNETSTSLPSSSLTVTTTTMESSSVASSTYTTSETTQANSSEFEPTTSEVSSSTIPTMTTPEASTSSTPSMTTPSETPSSSSSTLTTLTSSEETSSSISSTLSISTSEIFSTTVSVGTTTSTVSSTMTPIETSTTPEVPIKTTTPSSTLSTTPNLTTTTSKTSTIESSSSTIQDTSSTIQSTSSTSTSTSVSSSAPTSTSEVSSSTPSTSSPSPIPTTSSTSTDSSSSTPTTSSTSTLTTTTTPAAPTCSSFHMQVKSGAALGQYAMNRPNNIVKMISDVSAATRYSVVGTKLVDSVNTDSFWSADVNSRYSYVDSGSGPAPGPYAAMSCAITSSQDPNDPGFDVTCIGPGKQNVFQTCSSPNNNYLIVGPSQASSFCSVFTFRAVDCSDPSQIISSSTSSSTIVSTTTTVGVASCSPTYTGASYNYQTFFSGSGLITDPDTYSGNNNQGNRPPIYLDFDQSYSLCAVVSACANQASISPSVYYSFDLHFFTSSSQWQCIIYYNQGNVADFKVVNADASIVYGYNVDFE